MSHVTLTWNVSHSVPLSSKTSNQYFIVLLNEVETAIVGHECSDLLPIFDQLNMNALSKGTSWCGIQWNPSVLDTLGTASSVLIKGGVLISGVSL